MTASPLAAVMWVALAALLAVGTHLAIFARLVVPAVASPARRRVGQGLALLGSLLPLGMMQLLFMRHVPRALASPLMWIAFSWGGVVYFLVFAVAGVEALRLALRPGPVASRRLARGCAACALLAAAAATRRGLAPPAVVRTELRGPAALSGYRIVQISDLHVGPTIGRAFVRDVVSEVNRLDPDLVVMTGDLVDGSVGALAPEIAPLAGLMARDGVVLVLGNHEYLSGADAWAAHFAALGFRVLRNARLSLPRLEVLGLDDYAASDFGAGRGPDLARSLEGLSGRRPTLLLAHQPLAFEGACRAGVDLALAGHTHGGQEPLMALLDRLGPGYVAGRYQCGATHLYVSSGAGYWGPPMRVGSRSEIALLEFVGDSSAGPSAGR